jgi:L-2-hydroxycarboxylate dehydrogenase (NAD+)
MKMTIEDLRKVMTEALVGAGVPRPEAVVGVEMCLDAELRGHSSHGLRLVRNLIAEYTVANPRRSDLSIVSETPSSARVDGGYHLSLFVHRHAVDIAIEKATNTGVAIVSVANAGVGGAVGYLVERIAAAGLFAVALNTTPSTVVAPGTRTPALGTNPIAFSVPRGSRPPVVLDMATSSIAFNQVRQLAAAGGDLPPGVALDELGDPTTDPQRATDAESGRARILPFGGHRGFGLALMLELIVSGGVLGRTGDEKRGPSVMEPGDFGAIYIAFSPEIIGDPVSSSAAITSLVEELESEGARVPGESSRRLRDERLASGSLELTDEVRQILGV